MQTPGRARFFFAQPGCVLEGPFQNAGVFSASGAGIFAHPGRAQENKVASRLRLETAF
jgi:hypothetical protein